MERRSLKCPSCGLDNSADETYCDDCGALLTSSPVVLDQRERVARLGDGFVLSDRYRVLSSTVDGIFHVYTAERVEDGATVRILEDSEAPALETERDAASGGPSDDDRSHVALAWRALASAESTHLWHVTDFVYHEGRGFIVGDALPRWDLHTYRQDEGALSNAVVRAVGLAILDALGDLHDRGYLHLGIQPQHMYIDDAGLAILDGYERLARTDALPEVYSVIEGYSSPEAFGVGGTPGTWSDVYGAGVTLYFLLSGQGPAAVSREQFFFFPPLSSQVRGVPPALEAVVMKALSKDPKGRFQTAHEMREALEAVDVSASEPAAVTAAPETSAAPDEPPPSSEAAADRSAPQPSAPSAAAVLATNGTGGFPSCRIGVRSHVGCVRSVNQDSLVVLGLTALELSAPTNALLAVVADGMGGEAEGDKASSLAIRSMAAHLLESHVPVRAGSGTSRLRPTETVARLEELVRESMEEANRVIFEYAQQDESRRGMGSTLTALMIDGPHAVFGHAGDTRAYLLRAGSDEVDQVTEDHSLVGKLVRLGQLTREEARVSPQRSYLYRAMGTQRDIEIDVYARTIGAGDRILMCSDGVWEYFSEREIVDFLKGSDNPQETCEQIIDETLRRGADDNATALVVHVPHAH